MPRSHALPTSCDRPIAPDSETNHDDATGPRAQRLKACVDVSYRAGEAVSACLLFARWQADRPLRSLVERTSPVAPYIPGQFYRRELPPLLATLRQVITDVDVVIVDGYVWLGREQRPGLGAHLYEALDERAVVIGVAKTTFHNTPAVEVRRDRSARPLYVTAVGMTTEAAARHIREMHGRHRLPTLLREVDQLSRQA